MPARFDLVQFIAFGFGAGKAPVAPGTFGTLVGIPCYWLLQELPLWQYLLICAVLSVIGIWLCGETARRMGVHDHPGIVWDEIVGYLITMTAAPAGWVWIAIGFVLFRFFDIIKPWPIHLIDRHVHGGFGIMVDDLLAGVYAAVALQAIAALY